MAGETEGKITGKHFWTGVAKVALGVSIGIVIGIPTVNAIRSMFKSATAAASNGSGSTPTA